MRHFPFDFKEALHYKQGHGSRALLLLQSFHGYHSMGPFVGKRKGNLAADKGWAKRPRKILQSLSFIIHTKTEADSLRNIKSSYLKCVPVPIFRPGGNCIYHVLCVFGILLCVANVIKRRRFPYLARVRHIYLL